MVNYVPEPVITFTAMNPIPRAPTVSTPPPSATTFDSYEEAHSVALARNRAAAATLNSWQQEKSRVIESNNRALERAERLNRRAVKTALTGWLAKVKDKVEEAAAERPHVGHTTALEMVGNPGQMAIINSMGFQAFAEVSESYRQGESGDEVSYFTEALKMYASHPEAVSEILAGSATAMAGVKAERVNMARPRTYQPNLRPMPRVPRVQTYQAGEIVREGGGRRRR